MTGASKILTVSYGTFSCTLEGFDDPFTAMKAIAEYFRDLAADDRYFGAEPPTPDAAMLSRIAERKTRHRVEAKVEDRGVVLRAAESADPPPVATPQPAPVAPQPTGSGLLADESVAAKLQRIRAAVARSAAMARAPVIEDAVFAEDDEADIAFPAPVVMPAAAAPDLADRPVADLREQWREIAADTGAGPTEAIEAGTEELLREVFESEAFPEPPVEDAIKPVEAAMRLEDVAELPEVHIEATPEDLPEDISTGFGAFEDDARIASLVSEAALISGIEAAYAGKDGLPASRSDAELPTADDSLQKDDHAIGAGVENVSLAVADRDVVATEDVAEVRTTEAAAAHQSGGRIERPEQESPLAAEVAWPADPDAPARDAEIAEKARRARARVVTVRHPGQPLPAQAEAGAADKLRPAENRIEAAHRSEHEGRTILESAAKGAEDMTRLLRQTNTEMEGAESKRRMSTLAHLKAAVAATVAELRATGPSVETGEPSRLDRYRADLARVVGAKRSDGAPVTDRPSPLVLVSEQRIDRPSNIAASPRRVMPRRVSNGTGNLAVVGHDSETDAETVFASSVKFAEFARRLGASELTDLLEAAAAYSACVEGREHFSRPHLMRYVSAVTADGSGARDESMRSFGQLLRQGKIAQVEHGQFTITDSSRYLAEARRMTR